MIFCSCFISSSVSRLGSIFCSCRMISSGVSGLSSSMLNSGVSRFSFSGGRSYNIFCGRLCSSTSITMMNSGCYTRFCCCGTCNLGCSFFTGCFRTTHTLSGCNNITQTVTISCSCFLFFSNRCFCCSCVMFRCSWRGIN